MRSKGIVGRELCGGACKQKYLTSLCLDSSASCDQLTLLFKIWNVQVKTERGRTRIDWARISREGAGSPNKRRQRMEGYLDRWWGDPMHGPSIHGSFSRNIQGYISNTM